MKPQSHKPKCWLASLITREKFISLTDWRVVAGYHWVNQQSPFLRCSLSSFTTIWQLVSSMQATENLVLTKQSWGGFWWSTVCSFPGVAKVISTSTSRPLSFQVYVHLLVQDVVANCSIWAVLYQFTEINLHTTVDLFDCCSRCLCERERCCRPGSVTDE